MNSNEKRQWVKRHFLEQEKPLLRYTMRFVDQARALEIVQDSFLELLKFEPPSALIGKERPWLFRVCRNRALDRLKKEGKMKNLENEGDLPFEGESADQKISRQQDQLLAGQLLKNLKPNQREVVRLKFQEGLSYKEISKITGHSVSHVGVILHEAIGQLRKLAKKQLPLEKGGAQ